MRQRRQCGIKRLCTRQPQRRVGDALQSGEVQEEGKK